MAVLLTSVLVFVLGTGIAKADGLTAKYGQGTCQEHFDNNTGESVEFYGEIDNETDTGTIGFRYVIEFQKPKPVTTSCDRMLTLTERRMALEIEKQELELKLLRQRTTQTRSDDTDW